MLQVIVEKNILFYFVLAACLAGAASQLVLNRIYHGLIQDTKADAMGKNRFMKQMRQRFQNYEHLNEKITNVHVFLDRSVMEYEKFGLSLHQWTKLGNAAAIISVVLALLGFFLSRYLGYGMEIQQNYLLGEGGALAFLIGWYGILDNRYQHKWLMTSLEDCVENTGVLRSYPKVVFPEEEKKAQEDAAVGQEVLAASRRGRRKATETRAQKEKRELKENLTRIKQEVVEAAGPLQDDKERSREILKQMDPVEQERVLKEFLQEIFV